MVLSGGIINDSEYSYRSEDLFQSGITFDGKVLSDNFFTPATKGYVGISI